MYIQSDIKLLVIDRDAEATCSSLKRMGGGIHIAGFATDHLQGLGLVLGGNYDMVLLGYDGNNATQMLELARIIRNDFYKPFLFAAQKDNAGSMQTSVDPGSFGIILKPFEETAVIASLHNALRIFCPDNRQRQPVVMPAHHFFVKLGEKYKRIDWKDVVYLRSDNRYTCLFNSVDEREYPIRATLIKTMQAVMPEPVRNNFVQINRAEAVQVNHITEFSGHELKTFYKTMYLSEGGCKELRSRILCLA